ncbi:hypothetical protein ACFE04_026473 [Oxalis oulophora]
MADVSPQITTTTTTTTRGDDGFCKTTTTTTNANNDDHHHHDTSDSSNQVNTTGKPPRNLSVMRHCTSSAWLAESEADIAKVGLKSPSDNEFQPVLRSGSYSEKGPKQYMEDEYIRVDNLLEHLGKTPNPPCPGAFYGVFDGHGGIDAASFIKKNILKFIVEDSQFPTGVRKAIKSAFAKADHAFADATSLDKSSGTTALTALIMGRTMLIANVGDSRAVLGKRGRAIELSKDHKPNCTSERLRIEKLGGVIYDGYLNGQLSVARALGDWHIKGTKGSSCPLSSEPELEEIELSEEDEFLIIGCDGLWDVMSSQCAVTMVRKELMQHNDPEKSSKALVKEALQRNTCDNLTVVVVCFSADPPPRIEIPRSHKRRSISAEGLDLLKVEWSGVEWSGGDFCVTALWSGSTRLVIQTPKITLSLSFSSSTPLTSTSAASLPSPSDDHIARLILDQKTPSEALQSKPSDGRHPTSPISPTHNPPTVLSSTTMSFRHLHAVRQLLDEMPQPIHDDVFITIIRGLARARMIHHIIQIPHLISVSGNTPSLKVFNSILDVLVKQDIDLASKFFRNTMMKKTGLQADHYTYAILMKGLCSTNRIVDAFKLLQFIKARCLNPNTVIYIYNTLLHALCSLQKVGRARSLMTEMQHPNDVTFNILISGYCKEDNFAQALALLDKVESKGGQIDVVAYNTLIKGYCGLGKMKVARLELVEGNGACVRDALQMSIHINITLRYQDSVTLECWTRLLNGKQHENRRD